VDTPWSQHHRPGTDQLQGPVGSLPVPLRVDNQPHLLGSLLDLTVGSHLAQELVGNLHLLQGDSPLHLGPEDNLQGQGLADNPQHPGLADNLQVPGLADNLREQGDNLAGLVGSRQVHQDIPDIHRVAAEGTKTHSQRKHVIRIAKHFPIL